MKFRIDIEPRAKGRPKTHIIKGNVFTYTPTKTRQAEDYIKSCALQFRNQAFQAHTAVKLKITFYRHKSKWLKGAQKREVLPVRKPDLTNLAKLAEDGINGILMADDSQVTTMILKKRWSKNGQGYILFDLSEDKDA